MLLSEILDILPPNIYSRQFGKALGAVMIEVKKKYNSINTIELHTGANPPYIYIMMHPGSNVPVATMLRTATKSIGIQVPLKFEKHTDSHYHTYQFTWPDDTEIDSEAFLKGLFDDTAAANSYGADLGSMVHILS